MVEASSLVKWKSQHAPDGNAVKNSSGCLRWEELGELTGARDNKLYFTMRRAFFYSELNEELEFDFNSLLNDKSFETISGIPVKIDKIIRDITGETVLAVSGVLIVLGTRVRAVWDLNGKVIEYNRIRNFLMPWKNWECKVGDEDMLTLVRVEKLLNK